MQHGAFAKSTGRMVVIIGVQPQARWLGVRFGSVAVTNPHTSPHPNPKMKRLDPHPLP